MTRSARHPLLCVDAMAARVGWKAVRKNSWRLLRSPFVLAYRDSFGALAIGTLRFPNPKDMAVRYQAGQPIGFDFNDRAAISHGHTRTQRRINETRKPGA